MVPKRRAPQPAVLHSGSDGKRVRTLAANHVSAPPKNTRTQVVAGKGFAGSISCCFSSVVSVNFHDWLLAFFHPPGTAHDRTE
jgi:hypothetical protein